MATITKEEVQNFLKSVVEDYEKASPKFFDHFYPNATIFPVSQPTRVDGIAEYKKGFQLEATKGKPRRSQILSLDIQISDGSAVASYHNRVMVNDAVMNLRVTLMINKDAKGQLKILHMHCSPLSAPVVSREHKDLSAVTVLEERVATAAAMVGTPR